MAVHTAYASGAEPTLTRLRRALRSVRGALRTSYPDFALGLPLRRDQIPVFVYHEIEPQAFARDLEFLHRNGYRTLGLEEFMALSGSKSGRVGRCVLLTFDDARRNFHDSALPVLRSFGARAALFAPTHWMETSSRLPADAEQFMNWEQLQGCVQSGLVDVQSHGHRHALVFTSGALAAFSTPRTLARYDIYDWPMRNTSAGDLLGRPPLGTPLYAATPLLSARRRYVEDPEIATACADAVARGGGADFFRRPDALPALQQVFATATHRRRRLAPGAALATRGRYLDGAEFEALQVSEFEHSRYLFQRHLGYSPTFFAYPWMLGSDHSLEIACRFALRAVFGVALDYGRAKNPRLAVRAFGRFKCDWLPLLPGAGRGSLLAVAARKIGGIAATQHLAH